MIWLQLLINSQMHHQELINSQNHIRKLLNGTAKVSPGSTHLIPLAKALQDKLSGPINDYIASGETEQPIRN